MRKRAAGRSITGPLTDAAHDHGRHEAHRQRCGGDRQKEERGFGSAGTRPADSERGDRRYCSYNSREDYAHGLSLLGRVASSIRDYPQVRAAHPANQDQRSR